MMQFITRQPTCAPVAERIQAPLQQWQALLLPLFPERIQTALRSIQPYASTLEEIRIRVNHPVQIVGAGSQLLLPQPQQVTADECRHILSMLSHHSLYAFDEELCRGCITLAGGFRVGLGGKLVMQGQGVYRLSCCTYFNFRIARQMRGCANALMPYLRSEQGRIENTLVLSAPGCGKTTLLRDIARQLAQEGEKVCVIDERSELAGCWEGIPKCDVGSRTDVIDGCPKQTAINLALRSLSPQVLITDEIATMQDVQSLLQAQGAGVGLIASAHASGIQDVPNRPVLKALYHAGCFTRYILLDCKQGVRTRRVYDQDFTQIGGLDEAYSIGAHYDALCVAGMQECL